MHANLEIKNIILFFYILFIKPTDSPIKSLYIQKQQYPEFLKYLQHIQLRDPRF